MATQKHICTVTPKPKVQLNLHVDEEQAVGHFRNAIAEIPHAVKNSVETSRDANKERRKIGCNLSGTRWSITTNGFC